MRRSLLISQPATIYFVLAPAGFAARAEPLTLQPEGTPRKLQALIFGASTTAFYEHLLDNPAKIATLKTMAIGPDVFRGALTLNFTNGVPD